MSAFTSERDAACRGVRLQRLFTIEPSNPMADEYPQLEFFVPDYFWQEFVDLVTRIDQQRQQNRRVK